MGGWRAPCSRDGVRSRSKRGRLQAGASLVLAAIGAGTTSGCADDGASIATSSDELTRASKAAQLLYPAAAAPSACASGTDDARVRCLLRAKYASDPTARDVALDLYARTGGVAGLLPAQTYDGGYRGMLSLVPELPVGTYRQHLVWTRDAMTEIDGFLKTLDTVAPQPIAYRYANLDFRFFRSVGRTTPSAFTRGDSAVAYNVSGSLHTSAAAVRETLFHEIFHENDFAQNEWSLTLAPVVNAIVARCGGSTACLAPYAPTDTTVRGGTYYAFQQGNGPLTIEYSAELATRYYEEQSAILHGTTRPGGRFKCGPVENRTAWTLLKNAFFGGADLVPACP